MAVVCISIVSTTKVTYIHTYVHAYTHTYIHRYTHMHVTHSINPKFCQNDERMRISHMKYKTSRTITTEK